MTQKVIIRSATIDRHGDMTTVDMLRDYADAVNGPLKMRYLANHRRDIPPMGYFDGAEIQNIDCVYHVWVLPIEYTERAVADWDDNLITTGNNTAIFNEPQYG